MSDNSYEKLHLKKIRTFTYITIAILFLMVFIFISVFILYFPMIGIMDVAYFIPKLAILSFLISILFSILSIKNLFGKIVLALNALLMLYMIVFGP